MALSDLNQIRTTDMQTVVTDYTAGEEPWNKTEDSYNIDSQITEVKSYICDWNKWHGLYRKIPEIRSSIDTECRWIIGKELICDDKTKKIIDRIRGNGKQTFRQILFNAKRVSKICGDSHSEIIRDKAGRLVNLKILDAGTIEVTANSKNIINHYNQISDKYSNNKKVLADWQPNEIFHIMNDAIADEIHGIPETEKLIKLIKKLHLGLDDYSVILHRYGKPTFFYEANTDDETELAKITTTINNAVKNFENVVMPKGTLDKIEKTSVPQYTSIDPLPWFKYLKSYFTESSNVPEVIRGRGEEINIVAGKLNVASFRQKIIMQQREYSEQIEAQLGLDIKFQEPEKIEIEQSFFNNAKQNTGSNEEK